MTFPQKIIHYLGQSIGSLLKVFKLRHKKQKLNPTSLEESSKMSPKTPSQDLVSNELTEQALQSYREAAKSDSYMFGDYDGYQAYQDYGDIPD